MVCCWMQLQLQKFGWEGLAIHLCVDDANNTFGADKEGDKEGADVLELLESVDDDMDRLGVGMVKISESSAAKYD